MNNYKRIKDMDKTELANFLCNLMCGNCCENRCPARKLCGTWHRGMEDWLESEIFEADDTESEDDDE